MNTGEWRIKNLVLCHGAIIALLLSFFLPAVRPAWEWIDTAVFRATNATLEGNSLWQIFWALGNHKLADWFEDLCIIAFWIVYVRSLPKESRPRGIAEMIFSFLLTAFVIVCINRVVFRETLEYYRDSPTRLYDDCIRLSEKLPWIHVKDVSVKSFPSDHATFALLFGLSFTFFATKRFKIYACLYTLFLCLPRLMSGAHWLSDILVGSCSIILFVAAWVFCTPLHGWIINRFEAMIRWYGKKQLSKAP